MNLLALLFNPEDEDNFKYQLTFSRLQNIISKKIKIFVSCDLSLIRVYYAHSVSADNISMWYIKLNIL
jgi:hypothetical protein